ncbi:glutamate--tRNA ligase [Columbia Basin potato purple top phytoplasma]|uniref:Glutamate--tRNA ligase n=1 Tax=Columbia Basin potato purple top phytoplasma TaxID=307134 RepID=A0ABT5LBE8_9MOLU|nr:glutamate--tRNA ligase [Columbia Basin potato purple top phytoplasma]MDC9032027.1 glutamate--tRNA ligase [Columbia Basin potato purple top phytoplasma]
MQNIRVRYAPSPTGFLHIGNARTALFNYLFAKTHKGKFIIRIEDTDLTRNVSNSEISQLEQLKWLGIVWDEGPDCQGSFGPYKQSERLMIYQKYTQILLDKKLAYKEYQNNNDKFVVRFKVPSNNLYEFDDLIRGKLCFDSSQIEDWIIMKENNFPTYNYAVAIDDHLMQISHVLRGEEHITNTPKQMMIYKAFGWDAPIFCHMSLILNKNKKKLSKRDSDIFPFIKKYIDAGYLPDALFNFLFLLGFAPNSDKTIFSKKEIITLFNEKRFVKAPAVFDDQKLSFINNQYLKQMTLLELVEKTKILFEREKIFLEYSYLTKIVLLFRDRINYIGEIVDLYLDFFIKEKEIDDQIIFFLKDNKISSSIKMLKDLFLKLEGFQLSDIEQFIQNFSQLSHLKGKQLFLTIRISCTGRSNGPHLLNYLELLGKQKISKNIQKVLNILSHN